MERRKQDHLHSRIQSTDLSVDMTDENGERIPEVEINDKQIQLHKDSKVL